jgi:hypothetical protein
MVLISGLATRRQLGGISSEFSSIPVIRRHYPDNKQKNRDAQFCAEKWPEAQAEQMAGVHVFSSQEGAETIPRDGAVFYTMTRSCPDASLATSFAMPANSTDS